MDSQQNLFSNLNPFPPITHIRDVTEEAYKHVKGRADGTIVSAKTKFKLLNSKLMGGLELNTITTISAMSGAGKSTLAKELRHSISEHNPNLKFKQLAFNFEMMAISQVNREIVSKSRIKMQDLYSVDRSLDDDTIREIKMYYEDLKKSDIYLVEVAVTPEILCAMLYDFWERECKPGGYTMIYEVDNLMLLDGPKEKEKIDKANYGLVKLKKQIESEGGSSIGILLNQMNRNIEAVERVNTPEIHKPMASDLMAASSTNFCSDYIIFVHIPAKLGLKSYTNKRFPTKLIYPNNEIVDMAYLELVKNRSGEPNLTFALHNRMKYFSFDEMSVKEKRSIHGEDVSFDQVKGVKAPLIKLDK